MEIKSIFAAERRPYLWVILAGFLLYARTLSFDFTFLDDNVLIFGNYKFLSSISNVFEAFKQQAFKDSLLPYYRPILTVSFILDAQLGGLNLFVYHFTNILLHVITACLVFKLLTKLQYDRALAFLFSLIFTVHPMLTPAVAWIPGRNDSLLAIFIIISFLKFIDLMGSWRWRSYILHLLFFLLALFTKESAIVFAVICALYAERVKRQRPKPALRLAIVGGWAFVIAVWYVARKFALQGSHEMTVFDMARSLWLYAPAIIQLIGKAILPFNLSVFPTIRGTTILYGITAVALLAVLIRRSKDKRASMVVFGLVWCILFILPSLTRPSSSIVNDLLEHRFYLSFIGLIIILLETDLVRRFSWRKKSSVAVAAIILVAFSVMTVLRSGDFRDRRRFWTKAVISAPGALYPNLFMGYVCYLENDLWRAEKFVERALKIEPLAIRGHYYLGLIYMEREKYIDAAKEFRKEIALYPYYANAYVSLGAVYYKEGKKLEAQGLWNRALDMDPDNLTALRNLAIFYGEEQDRAKALFYVRELEKRGVHAPPDFVKGLDVIDEAAKK